MFQEGFLFDWYDNYSPAYFAVLRLQNPSSIHRLTSSPPRFPGHTTMLQKKFCLLII